MPDSSLPLSTSFLLFQLSSPPLSIIGEARCSASQLIKPPSSGTQFTMDNTANATAPSSEPQDTLPSESYPNPDQYADDELLLLHLADISNDPLPPGPEDAVDETNAPSSHAPDKKAASPLLMERPQSSGVDVTAFRFSKPLQRWTNFSSRSSKEQQSGASAPQGCKTSQGDQITTRESGYCNTAAGEYGTQIRIDRSMLMMR